MKLFMPLCAAVSLWLVAFAGSEAPDVRAMVLGIAQDGGLPHIGCAQPACATARRDPARRERVAALGWSTTPPASAS